MGAFVQIAKARGMLARVLGDVLLCLAGQFAYGESLVDCDIPEMLTKWSRLGDMIVDLFRRLTSAEYRRVRALSEPRMDLSKKYIRGSGIEIGALHHRLWLPKDAHVVYVDRLDETALRKEYPELAGQPLVKVDVIDDGETLSKFQPGSQDFIIANHFIEHTQNPIATLERHLEVLRPYGVIYMAVPDKRLTFDRRRENTDFAHLLRDYREGPAWSYEDHLTEYATLVEGAAEADLVNRVNWLRESQYSIHFHVWTEATFKEFLELLRTTQNFKIRLEDVVSNPPYGESIFILRKTS